MRPAPLRVSASAPRSEAKTSASLDLHPLREREGQAGREAIARAVDVLVRPGRRGAALYGPPGWAQPPSEPAVETTSLRRRLEVAGLVALGLVLAARDERVELDARRVQRRQLARGGDEHAGSACLTHRFGVAGREVDAVRLVELLPRQRPSPPLRPRLLADDGDRPLADLVHIDEPAPLRLVRRRRVHADAGSLEPDPSVRAALVAAEKAVERRLAGEPRQLDRCDATAAGRFLPRLPDADDLARSRNRLDPEELDPLHMPDDRDLHASCGANSHRCRRSRVTGDDGSSGQRPSLRAFLRRAPRRRPRLPPQANGWAGRRRRFQETFLRALRAYDRLEHGDHLRAWVLTIAARLVIDTSRRARPTAHELPELPVEDGRPAYAQIEHLADALPPTERAALVLRYAYDLSYDDIADALGSTPEAARQAASSGVRRLEPGGSMTVSPDLDHRFREAAAAEGLLDVGFDLVESPIGALLVAASDRGLCRIFFDADPERHLEHLARTFGPRVLRSAPAVDNARRQLDEYFEGRRDAFELESTSAAQRRSPDRCWTSSRGFRTGRRRPTAPSPAGSARRGLPAPSAR